MKRKNGQVCCGLFIIHYLQPPKKGTVGLMVMLGWLNVYCRQTMSIKFN